MRVERKLAEEEAAEEKEKRGQTSSSKKGRRKQKKLGRMPSSTSAVKRLFEMCKEVFADGGAGIVPSPEDIDRLRSVLDSIDASDVGLSQKMPCFRGGGGGGGGASKRPPPVTYSHIYECDKFSIGIFCLPPSGIIPLHNHPGMTVFSKLLFGSMHIKSYDWVNVAPHINPAEIINPLHFRPGSRLAKVKADAMFTAPCKTSVLYPEDGGNMHCFIARTACAVLDVLGPPYSNPDQGRDCTYYHDFPLPTTFPGDAKSIITDEDGAYALLEERKKPDDFVVVGAKYSGPKIMDD